MRERVCVCASVSENVCVFVSQRVREREERELQCSIV